MSNISKTMKTTAIESITDIQFTGWWSADINQSNQKSPEGLWSADVEQQSYKICDSVIAAIWQECCRRHKYRNLIIGPALNVVIQYDSIIAISIKADIDKLVLEEIKKVIELQEEL